MNEVPTQFTRMRREKRKTRGTGSDGSREPITVVFCLSLLLLRRWREKDTEDPGCQYRSDERADPVDVELLPCVVPIVHIRPPKSLQSGFVFVRIQELVVKVETGYL